MDDLISRQAVIDLIMETDPWWSEGITRQFFEGVKRLPSAQRKGEWVEAKPFIGKFCSTCGYEAYWDGDNGQQLFDFCPYCGAMMTKGENDESALP